MKKLLLFVTLLTISFLGGISYVSLTNASNVQVTVTAQDKLDAFLEKVSRMKNQLNNDTKYEVFLETMTGKLKELSTKYNKNKTIVEMINYLQDGVKKIKTDFLATKDMDNFFCELNDSCLTELPKTNSTPTSPTVTAENKTTITNTGAQKNCSFDECFNNGFYVIKSTNTQYPEGCNSEGLDTPEDHCILKIGKMYVAPKNFTFIEKPANSYAKSLVHDNRVNAIKNSVIVHSTPSAGASCHDVLTQLDAKYNRFTPQWDTSKASQFFAEREYVRNNSAECKALDNAANTPDPNKGKIQLVQNPQNCESLFSQILPEKKWKFIDEFGGDGASRNCTQNNSNKNGLCALELHLSKLQLYTDKPYYVGQNILAISYGSDYQMYQSSIANSFLATYLGDWKLLKPTPTYEKRINYSASMVQGPDGSYVYPTINGNIIGYSLEEGANGLYQICVGY